MNDKELADRIVALGFKETNWLSSSFAGQLSEYTYVRDWRVAGALLHCISYGQLIHICVDLFDQLEIRPRAICEACVEALEGDDE
jgi:hypothetical protein